MNRARDQTPYFRMRRDLTRPVAPAPLPAGIAVRGVDEAVAPACRALMNTVYAEGFGDVLPYDLWWQRLTADPDYAPDNMFVALAGAEAVGFCHGWAEAFIKDLVVAPAWRGHGLGAALLTLALRNYAAAGEPFVDLKTDVDNRRAQSLYTRLGFEIIERVG